MPVLEYVEFNGKVKNVEKVKKILKELILEANIDVTNNSIKIEFKDYDNAYDDCRGVSWVNVFIGKKMREIAAHLDGWLEAYIPYDESYWVTIWVGHNNIIMWDGVQHMVLYKFIGDKKWYKVKVIELYQSCIEELENKIERYKRIIKELKGGEK